MSEILESGGEKYILSVGLDCGKYDLNGEGCVADHDRRCVAQCSIWKRASSEVFTNDQVVIAIEQFLEYGEQTFCTDNDKIVKGHGGYFSGGGWAARCLKAHLEELKNNQ